MYVSGRSLMVKKNDGIKESTDSSTTIEDDGKCQMVSVGSRQLTIYCLSKSLGEMEHVLVT